MDMNVSVVKSEDIHPDPEQRINESDLCLESWELDEENRPLPPQGLWLFFGLAVYLKHSLAKIVGCVSNLQTLCHGGLLDQEEVIAKREDVEQPNHSCVICNETFQDQDDLDCHILAHTGASVYPCYICKKPFTRLFLLRRHQNVHTHGDPYSCGDCKESFLFYSGLKNHHCPNAAVPEKKNDMRYEDIFEDDDNISAFSDSNNSFDALDGSDGTNEAKQTVQDTNNEIISKVSSLVPVATNVVNGEEQHSKNTESTITETKEDNISTFTDLVSSTMQTNSKDKQRQDVLIQLDYICDICMIILPDQCSLELHKRSHEKGERLNKRPRKVSQRKKGGNHHNGKTISVKQSRIKITRPKRRMVMKNYVEDDDDDGDGDDDIDEDENPISENPNKERDAEIGVGREDSKKEKSTDCDSALIP